MSILPIAFNRNPVQFFCDGAEQGAETHQGIVGKVSGFTNQADGMVRLRLEQEGNKICAVLVPLQTLSRVPNGTSPGVLNGKRINIVGVEPEPSADGTCELRITVPNQLTVLIR